MLESFINSANATSSNPHPLANYYVIRDLSSRIFGNDFEKDMVAWKAIYFRKINKAAYQLPKANTRMLKKLGAKKMSQVVQ